LSLNIEDLFDNFLSLARISFNSAVSEVIIFNEPVERSALGAFAETRIFLESALPQFMGCLDGAGSIQPERASLEAKFACARMFMATPLLRDRSVAIGLVIVADDAADRFLRAQFRAFETIAKCMAAHYDLHGLAMEDPLTGALSRRGFEVSAEIELGRFMRYERPASMIMFDLDHFKSFNDQYGHATGDRVLEVVAATCIELKRAQDRFGRLGGEEFALILPETALAQALNMAERLRCAIKALTFGPNGDRGITASFGVKTLDLRTSDLTMWMSKCDAALYSAKRNGRDQVQIG